MQAWESAELRMAALVEIDFQSWIVDLAHDPGVIDCAAAVRKVMCHRPRVCTRYLDPEPGPRADPNSPEASFDPRLQPGPNDYLVTKYGKDIFANPEMDAVLVGLGVTTVVITGVLTGHGVALAAASARARGYHVVIVADACADLTPQSHSTALDALAAAGLTVVSSAPAESATNAIGAPRAWSKSLSRCRTDHQ